MVCEQSKRHIRILFLFAVKIKYFYLRVDIFTIVNIM